MPRLRTALACLLVIGAAPVALAADPVGRYTVEGKSPGGGDAYTGTAEVTKTGETYRVVWLIGGERYVGTAIGNAAFLAVSYKAGSNTGIALYAEQGDGWLGPWTYAGGTTLGAERWTRR